MGMKYKCRKKAKGYERRQKELEGSTDMISTSRYKSQVDV